MAVTCKSSHSTDTQTTAAQSQFWGRFSGASGSWVLCLEAVGRYSQVQHRTQQAFVPGFPYSDDRGGLVCTAWPVSHLYSAAEEAQLSLGSLQSSSGSFLWV